MNIDKLTDKEKKDLLKKLTAEQTKADGAKKKKRENLKRLTARSTKKMVDKLIKVSINLSLAKKNVFDTFENIIAEKIEMYGIKPTQRSHTFLSLDGMKRIRLGYRVFDRYDDTLDAGIAVVREYIESLANSENKELVDMLNIALQKDLNGNLKASRAVELTKYANESSSPLLKEGVEIIINAHYRERSRDFVEAEIKDEHGVWKSVGLSITTVDFPSEEKKQEK